MTRPRAQGLLQATSSLVVLVFVAACAPETETAVPGFGALLLRTALALVAVGALAVVSLRLAARHLPSGLTGVGSGGDDGPSPLRVLGRVPLGARTQAVALQAGARVLIVAVGPEGTAVLADLADEQWKPRAFADVLASTSDDAIEARRELDRAGTATDGVEALNHDDFAENAGERRERSASRSTSAGGDRSTDRSMSYAGTEHARWKASSPGESDATGGRDEVIL